MMPVREKAVSGILSGMTLQALFERSKALAAFAGTAAFDEPMFRHTTFNIGGPADLYLKPHADCFVSFTTALLRLARAEAVPVFILGGGANLLVSDAGIRGIVLDTGSWTGACAEIDTPSTVRAGFPSGTLTDDAVSWAAANGLSGLEDFASLPGTIGGAVWMNARCYERSVSDILVETTFLDEHLELVTIPTESAAFAYKKSPFQGRNTVILKAVFALSRGDPAHIAEKTASCRAERKAKGHFRYPSAGSIFKNNRDFGKPAGKIIEELGLRGFQIGGAQIAPWHGNFIINTGGATADDVKRLITLTEERALKTFGFKLEREVICVE
jgi:UDP-N-acetylmuramate dehydrogenase